MNNTITGNIKEIAERLDCGFRAFIHVKTSQMLFVPDDNNYSDFDTEAWAEELELLENNFTEYCEIEKWTSSEAFEIMSEFTDQLTDNNLQSRLLNALRKKKPFREFKFVIDSSGDFRQLWFDFKNKWQQDFVSIQLNRIKLIDE
jgi:hypothetical protein